MNRRAALKLIAAAAVMPLPSIPEVSMADQIKRIRPNITLIIGDDTFTSAMREKLKEFLGPVLTWIPDQDRHRFPSTNTPSTPQEHAALPKIYMSRTFAYDPQRHPDACIVSHRGRIVLMDMNTHEKWAWKI